MPGELSLTALLAGMQPELQPGEFVFCHWPAASLADHEALNPLGVFVENEGLTLILPRSTAEGTGLEFNGVFRQITLRVHSSLQAVGLTAAVAGRLAECGISANVVAAYFHDHIFVPADRADEALLALSALQSGYPGK